MSSTKGFLLRYSLQSFGAIVFLAVLIRFFLFSSYAMSGSAMLPSIWPGDFLVASRIRVKDLRRGAVVALRCPNANDRRFGGGRGRQAGGRQRHKDRAQRRKNKPVQHLPSPFCEG